MDNQQRTLIIEQWQGFKMTDEYLLDGAKLEFCFDAQYQFGGFDSQTYGDDYSWIPNVGYEKILAVIDAFEAGLTIKEER